MDSQCFNNQIPLFESGTTGTKGNTQPVIPFLTETYSNSADPPQETTFPACTIKSFPNNIQHTIHWAMDTFEMFNRAPININKYLDDKTIFDKETTDSTVGKEDVKVFFTELKINCFEDCIYQSWLLFNNYFNTEIKKLLTTFPENHINDDGNKFWSNGKRMPTPIDFDNMNEYHLDFIEATSNIIANIYQIKDILSREAISLILYNISNYKFKGELNETIKLIPQEFEKDDDSNYHVAFVTATSNLRALNYGIPPISKQETKGIAGRIIPAIATTTSVVSGLVVIEMIKYMLAIKNKTNKIENYRSTYVNLADTNIVYSEPFASKEIEIAGKKYNGWTKFSIHGDRCLKDFKKHFEDLFQVEINTILLGTSMLYCPLFDLGEELFDTLMSELIKNIDPDFNKLNPVIITILTDNDDIILPQVQITV